MSRPRVVCRADTRLRDARCRDLRSRCRYRVGRRAPLRSAAHLAVDKTPINDSFMHFILLPVNQLKLGDGLLMPLQYPLTGFMGLQARSAAKPRAVPMRPSCRNPNRTCGAIDENSRVADPVTVPSRIFTLIHNDLHGFPGPSAVSRARHSDIDISWQVPGAVVTNIVDRD